MTETAVNLANCDREPIHIPGAIQVHGCLIACDPGLEFVKRHSANASATLRLSESDINGCAFSDLVGAQLAHQIRNALSRTVNPRRPALLFDCLVGSSEQPFDISVHTYNDTAVVEFEPKRKSESKALDIARDLIARAQTQGRLDELLAQTPRLLRAILGYDRVMIYKFATDGSGKVIAEAKRRDLESFSGQHFPADDIPQQARALYLKNTIRVINDAHDLGCSILPVFDASGTPLDLSFAHLRSVSPIHLEYLRNMGVAASMSLSVIVGGALWGLVACHHYAPKALSMSERVAAETFAEVFSLRVEAFDRETKLQGATEARKRLDQLLQATTSETDVGKFLFGRLAALRELVVCEGVGIYLDGEWRSLGATPPTEAITDISAVASLQGSGRVWSTHELSSLLPSAAAFAASAAGVMAVPLSQLPRDYLFFFRREQVQTLNWGGDPNKVYASGPNGDRLSPRTSFEIWKQTVKLQSERWSEIDLQTGEAARIQLLEIMMRHSEVLSLERRASDVRQKTLNEELNHRVKNILALIKSLVSHDISTAQDVTSFANTLKGRILALSNAHDQVARSDGGGLLSALIRAELGPYRGIVKAIDISGPEVAISARAYSVLALVLHELATNAAKYGALSTSHGRLGVVWRLTANGDCELKWRESGGPAVEAPSRIGFGVALIRRSVPFDLGGESEANYALEGLQVRLLLPAAFIEDRSQKTRSEAASYADFAEASHFLNGKRVLLVEDQFVIALDAEGLLKENGVSDVELAATPDEARRAIGAAEPNVAVLDVNLGRFTSLEIADLLADLGIPFIFATGYGDSAMISQRHKHVPVVRKPYSSQTLISGLSAVLREPQEGHVG